MSRHAVQFTMAGCRYTTYFEAEPPVKPDDPRVREAILLYVGQSKFLAYGDLTVTKVYPSRGF